MPAPHQSAPKLRSFDAIPFHEPEAARKSFERISLTLPPVLVNALPALLAESPDPDSALLLFDRLVNESGPEVLRLLGEHPFLAHYALAVFGTSWYLGETLIRNPELFHSFLREKRLDHSCSREDFSEALARFQSRSFDRETSLLLARFKKREYVRIMLRDVLRIAPLAETTAEISALSDVLLEEALREAASAMQRRFGLPQHLDPEGRVVNTAFAVMSLGKLGGNELNYSSDIDLLFVFGDGHEPPGAPISSREYFVRLAQQMTEILSRPTAEGAVFRIDLRLRPQGNEGELAVNLSHALRYYASTAHDWERQALIKVRYSAGDEKLAREFIRQIQPQVYKHQVNFAAIKTALRSREKIDRKRSRQTAGQGPDRINVKIDRGGIRDIEFLVQCLQRVYGGAEPWLRSGGTLFSLHKLHDKRHISGRDFHELTSAYSFLRHLEHRLQLRRGQQVHRLPESDRELQVLLRSMEDLLPESEPFGDLHSAVRARMSAVGDIYQRLIYQQQDHTGTEPPDDGFQLQILAPAGEPPHQRLLQRLAEDAPAIPEALIACSSGSTERKNLLRFLSSAFSSSERYAAVLRHQNAIVESLPLFGFSEYLTDILVRHPEEVFTLAQVGSSTPDWSGGKLFSSLNDDRFAGQDPVFAYVANAASSHEEKVAMLRRHFGHCLFASGARDIVESRPVYASLAETTVAAEGAIMAAFGMTGSPSGFAVLALGRLGSREFDLLSDADLIFVGDEKLDRQKLTGVAEELVQSLSAYTQEGLVFPVDARLRPRGAEGELLVTPSQLETYFATEAQPWEALTYTKLRFVAGDARVARRAESAVEALFARFAHDQKFADEVRAMRLRLEQASAPERSIRTAPGALYDADFLSGFLLVANRIRPKAGTLRDRVWRCAGAGVLDKQHAATLDHAAELCRTVEHVLRLVTGRNTRWLPAAEHPRQAAEKLTSQILRREFPHGLEQELLATFTRVREIYERVVK
jgi:[glutamine synthetase] adenylyltransferase / [glutamine synthetase]-adenylyl-L-tyrosine phosphorylase